MHFHRAEIVEPLHAVAVDAAIGYQCTGSRQANLAAVGVTRERELVAVGRELLQHAGFGSVEEGQGQISILVGRTRDFGVIIQIVVWIVHAGGGKTDVAHLKLMPSLVGIAPSVLHKGGAHTAPGQIHIGRLPLFAQQILEGIDRTRGPVVIGAKDKEAGAGQQRTESAQRIGYGLLIGEIIAGVDYEVRLQGCLLYTSPSPRD